MDSGGRATLLFTLAISTIYRAEKVRRKMEGSVSPIVTRDRRRKKMFQLDLTGRELGNKGLIKLSARTF